VYWLWIAYAWWWLTTAETCSVSVNKNWGNTNNSVWRRILFPLNKIYTYIFSTNSTFTWNISHSKKNSAKHCHKCENIFGQSSHYSCWIAMKLEFCGQSFGESSDTKFDENPFSGSRVVQCARTDRRTDGHRDRHDESKGRVSHFFEHT
jgi:hypothetical protein